MPTTLHDREVAFEAKFAHDEEFRFLVAARRDKLFARWAAERLHLSDGAGNDLVKEVLAIPNGPGHDRAVLTRIAEAFARHGDRVQDRELSAALDLCAQQARQQLLEAPLDHPEAAWIRDHSKG